jgi:DNA-nicking Smr family endonuclease
MKIKKIKKQMKFNIDEKVGFLYETGGGIIKSFNDKKIYSVEDESGFNRTFQENELVKLHSSDYKFSNSIDLQVNEDETLSKTLHYEHKEVLSGSKRAVDVWEIDLHIEEIVESHLGLSNFQILTKQINEFKSFYKKAKAKHLQKIVVIHGVGEGVLKEEIRSYLSKQEGIEYFDSDFREYGKGATTIEIHYNYK